MAITNFIPTIWSENLYSALDKKYVAVAHCNREYEGEIKNKGSVVKICGVGSIDVTDYTKDTDMANPQSLSDTVTELAIDQAKCFNFQIDDIDRAQCTPRLMDAAMKVAADSLANTADKYVFQVAASSDAYKINCGSDANDIIDCVIEARQKLYENNVSDTNNVVLEVSPYVGSLLLKGKVLLASDNTDALENGCIGKIAGCKVFITPNIVVDDSDRDHYHKCVMRTTRAIAFAEQLSEIDAYRPEKRFADAVKGLHIYGAKAVHPEEMVIIDVLT